MNNLESEKNIEKQPNLQAAETGYELAEDVKQGAEMLERPADGSFLHGLQVFVAWVNAMLDDKPKT